MPGIATVSGPDARRRVDALLQSGHVWVVDADLKSYFDTIPHDRLMALVKERIGDVNRSLRGWNEYFQQSKATTFPSVDGWVRMRLRSLLRWRQGKKGRGRGCDHQKWTNQWFARQGLFSLENAHEFTVTVLRLRTH